MKLKRDREGEAVVGIGGGVGKVLVMFMFAFPSSPPAFAVLTEDKYTKWRVVSLLVCKDFSRISQGSITKRECCRKSVRAREICGEAETVVEGWFESCFELEGSQS